MPTARLSLAALSLSLAVSAWAGEAARPAASSPAAAKEEACRKAFDLRKDFQRLQVRLEELEKVKPQLAAELKSMVAAHQSCSALLKANNLPCRLLGIMQGPEAEAACSDQQHSFAFWIAAHRGAPTRPMDFPFCALHASTTVPDGPQRVCAELAASWKNHEVNFCDKAQPALEDPDQCRLWARQFQSPQFQPYMHASEQENFEGSLRYHMWRRQRQTCSDYRYYGKGTEAELAARRGACLAAFRPAACAELLIPVANFLCYPLPDPKHWKMPALPKH